MDPQQAKNDEHVNKAVTNSRNALESQDFACLRALQQGTWGKSMFDEDRHKVVCVTMNCRTVDAHRSLRSSTMRSLQSWNAACAADTVG